MRITHKTKKVAASSDVSRGYLYYISPVVRAAVRNYLKETEAHPQFSCVIENDDVMRIRVDGLIQADSLANFLRRVMGDSKLAVHAVGGDVIEISMSQDVDASSEIDQTSSWEYLDFEKQINDIKRFVRDYKGSKVFEDFAEHVSANVEDIIDTFCDAEAHGFIEIPWNKQKDSEYANDDIYGSADSYERDHDSENRTFFNEDELSELRSEIYTELLQIMQSPEFGFDRAEAEQYIRVDVSYTENNMFVVEVGAEVSYDGMCQIKDILDPIIQEYDPDSYFEMVDSGTMSAHINCDSCINSSSKLQRGSDHCGSEPVEGAYDYYNLPGPGDYDPPEYDEGRELDPEVDTVECTLDAIIIVDEDGDYEYEDKSYEWAAGYSRDGDWESNIYSGLTLCSKIDVVENVDEMLMDMLDYTPGRYHIQGEVTLKFDIDGAVAYSNNAKYEEDYEEIIEVDSSDVTYNKKESYIEGFIQEPVVS